MSGIVNLLILIVQLFDIVLLARVLLSWFPNVDRSNQLIQLVYDITEPFLRPIRRLMPQTGMMDFSPIVLFLIIQVLLSVIQSFIRF